MDSSAASVAGELQTVQVGEKIVELLLGEGTADGRHHVASAKDGLADESLVGGESAGQKRFLEQALQARAILSGNRVRVMAGRARLLIEVPPRRLAGIEAELGIRLS